MSTKPAIGKTSKREVVYVEVTHASPHVTKRDYDVIRVCCRYESGKVAISAFPGFDVRPLSRGADLPCDSDGVYQSFLPHDNWTPDQKAEWGRYLQAGLLDDVRMRRPASVAWKMVLEVCQRNHLTVVEKGD